MKHTKEEIVAALQVIKDECSNYGTQNECCQCPFHHLGEGCMLQRAKYPQYWNIVHVEPEKTWRAFE